MVSKSKCVISSIKCTGKHKYLQRINTVGWDKYYIPATNLPAIVHAAAAVKHDRRDKAFTGYLF